MLALPPAAKNRSLLNLVKDNLHNEGDDSYLIGILLAVIILIAIVVAQFFYIRHINRK